MLSQQDFIDWWETTGKMTGTMREHELLSESSKDVVQDIVEFYRTVGDLVNLNPRATEVFAYLRIYEALTQEQLRQLTGFSLSTISSTLQSFLQTDIVDRSMILGTHTNLYKIKSERVKFDYTPPVGILEDLEALDQYIMEKQAELRGQRGKHPVEAEFLHRRLNSLRNYVEVQRRQISGEVRNAFFHENVSKLVNRSEVIHYPFDTRDLEEGLLGFLGHLKNDPVRAKILSIFFTHRSLDQQTLMALSGFSRSTISRVLRHEMKNEYIRALPREHRRPRVYYLDSISMSILSLILRADDFIFSSAPRFEQTLSRLQSQKDSVGNWEVEFLVGRVEEILRRIHDFKSETKPLRTAHQNLSEFLKKDT